ncbi:SUA7 Transcription initiation factor IIB [Candida maltosa Xu316]
MSFSSNNKYNGPNLNVTLTCPDCKQFPPDLVERFSEGDIICGQCGLVLSDRIVDTRSEWRTFQNDDKNGDDPSRVGDAGNALYDTEDLSTMISYNTNTFAGSGSKNNLNKIQQKSLVDKKNFALQAAYQRISELCNGYQLPKSVSDAAKHLYKAVREDRLLKGKSQDAIMAGTILLGCRRAEVPRTLEEIRALTNVPTKQIAKVSRLIKKIIHSHMTTSNQENGTSIMDETNSLTTHSAEDLIRRFCSHLGLDSTVTNGSEYVARKCQELGILAGRSPTTIAATSIFLAAKALGDTKLTQQQIRDKTGVSIGTIKNSYKILRENAKELIDPSWEENGKVVWDNVPKS